jgi:hypothetical protein
MVNCLKLVTVTPVLDLKKGDVDFYICGSFYDMNALKFFDYLCYWFYRAFRQGGSSSSEFLGGSIVGLFQTLNTLTIIMCFDALRGLDEGGVSTLTALLVYVAFIIYNYIRYIWLPKFSLEMIARKWHSESAEYRKIVGIWQILYVGLSAILFAGIILYYAIPKTHL